MQSRENARGNRLSRMGDALSRVLSVIFVAAVAVSLIADVALVRSLALV